MRFTDFLKTSYTCYHAAENVSRMLGEAGFTQLFEEERWQLKNGGAYFVVRGGSLVAFRYAKGCPYTVVASHTDSPCFKLKENALSDDHYTRLNAEPYGGGLWYTFFDRPLKLAGRRVCEENGSLQTALFASDFDVVIPSLAIHQNRDANEKFSPNLQTELPLLCLGKGDLAALLGNPLSYDLFAVPDAEPAVCGANGELLVSPRLDDLTGVYHAAAALLAAENPRKTLLCACFEAEEIGSRTEAGAGGDLFASVLERLASANGQDAEEKLVSFRRSLLVSLDNAHAVHPNHPEACDPSNRPLPGGGVVIKSHAGGAYATDAPTGAFLKKTLQDAGVKTQTFFNRSDARSGSTLGTILLSRTGMPAVDVGIAQLAMHSAAETVALADLPLLGRALEAIYRA